MPRVRPGPLYVSRHHDRHHLRPTPPRRPAGFLERRFRLREPRNDSPARGARAASPFLTMCYILFVNRRSLSAAGVPSRPWRWATASPRRSRRRRWVGDEPAVRARAGARHQPRSSRSTYPRPRLPWQVGMACVVIEGLVAVILVLAGLPHGDHGGGPMSLKLAIGVGIGLFIHARRPARGRSWSTPATGIGLGISRPARR